MPSRSRDLVALAYWRSSTTSKENAYRAMYTLKLESAVYVLNAFQKKSRKGIQTSKADIELVKRRLSRAAEIHEELFGKSKGARK